MKKSDLKSEMVVQFRNGSKYMFLEEIQNLSGEQYGYNITDFNEDLTHESCSDKDIVKVYRPRKHGCILNVINDSNKLIWDREKSNLTEHEVAILKALQTLSYEWLARDEDGELFAFNFKPEKSNTFWAIYENFKTFIGKDLFTFIKWTDEEPTNIKELEEISEAINVLENSITEVENPPKQNPTKPTHKPIKLGKAKI